MTKIYYSFDSYSHVTRHSDPDERWDADDTSTTWRAPDKVSLEKQRDSWREETDDLPWDVKPGDIVFMVWVQYSTGNSFGRSDGEYHEVVGWYQNAEDAYKCRDAIDGDARKPYEYGQDGNKVGVPTFDGKGTRPLYTGSWKGYFESLDHVSIETLRVCA